MYLELTLAVVGAAAFLIGLSKGGVGGVLLVVDWLEVPRYIAADLLDAAMVHVVPFAHRVGRPSHGAYARRER